MSNLIRFFFAGFDLIQYSIMQESELILQFSYNLPIILLMLKKLT